MREPKEIYEDFKKHRGLNFCEGLEDVFELMKFAQIEAYNEGIEDCIDNVQLDYEFDEEADHKVYFIEYDSILKLKK